MVVIGNPPYSGESANKGEWIMNLMEDYKKEPGGKEKLKERNPKSINDDYVKFMRFGQHFIDRNGEGILAFINPHGFLDNPTFRGMRWNLLKTYDKIYTIDLHGNSKKKEVSPDGSVDQNVFDIMQGVSINLLIKTGKKKKDELAKVFNYDLYGKREFKYDFLTKNSLKSLTFKENKNEFPMCFLIENNLQLPISNSLLFNIEDLFVKNGMRIATGNDKSYISFDKKTLDDNFKDSSFIKTIDYRLFDKRYIYYDNSKIERGRKDLMSNLLDKNNLGLISLKRARNNFTSKFGIVNHISDKSVVSTLDNGYIFPLYLYPETNLQQNLLQTPNRVPNLNMEMVQKFADGLGLFFTPEEAPENISVETNQLTPINILDYIYAVLHSPTYRETYKEFLKIDFPRVPYPTDIPKFIDLVDLGGQLRQLHLLESENVENYITQYPQDGDNIVGKLFYEKTSATAGKVYINYDKTPPSGAGGLQYFDNVPETAWNFYIGGYQPAQKWLKDRKERELFFEGILHYQKMIVALFETDRIMKEIDTIGV